MEVNDQEPNDNRIFLRSTDRKRLSETDIIRAISETWPELTLTKLRVHPSRLTAILETENHQSSQHILQNIRQLESKLKLPIIAEPYIKDHRRKTRSERKQPHAIAKDIPQEFELTEVAQAINQAVKKPPQHLIRLTCGLTGKPTKTVRIILQNQDEADYIIKNGILLAGILKIRCETPKDDSQKQRCFKCQNFGHDSWQCENVIRCRHCAGAHGYRDCTNRNTNPTCANCMGPHLASEKSCPKWRDYIKSLKDKADEKAAKNREYNTHQKRTESIKKSYVDAAKQTEETLKKELSENDQKIENCINEKLNQLQKTIEKHINQKIKEAIAPITAKIEHTNQTLNNLSHQLTTQNNALGNEMHATTAMIQRQMTKLQSDIFDQLNAQTMDIKTYISYCNEQLHKNDPPTETLLNESDTSLLERSQTDYVGAIVKPTTPQTPKTIQSPLSMQNPIEENFNYDISESLEKAATPKPVSPITCDKETTESNIKPQRYIDRDDTSNFLSQCNMSWDGYNYKLCEHCNFTKTLILQINASTIKGKSYTVKETQYHKTLIHEPRTECKCCAFRKQLNHICGVIPPR